MVIYNNESGQGSVVWPFGGTDMPIHYAARFVTAAALVLVLCGQTQAVIISGTGTDTAPTDAFPYWDNVVYRGDGSAVYLGNYWVMTAHHVGVGDIVVAGTTYKLATGSGVRVKNSDGSDTDMEMFRIVTDPGLPSITLNTQALQYNNTVRMIGYGWNREETQREWDGAWHTPPQTGTAYTGFKLTGTTVRTKRWGENKITTQSLDVITSSANGLCHSFATDWSVNGGSNEAQATIGDSGGAAFIYRPASQTWQLAGLIQAIGPSPGQPWNVYVYGNETYMADIRLYTNQINAAMGQSLWGDFNADRAVTAADIDLLRSHYGIIGYDLTHNGITDVLDADYLVRDILNTDYGDVTLDGQVNVLDLAALAGGYGKAGGWAKGDFDGNGLVNVLDLATLAGNYGKSFSAAAGAAAAVPEPLTVLLLGGGMLGLLRKRRNGVRS